MKTLCSLYIFSKEGKYHFFSYLIPIGTCLFYYNFLKKLSGKSLSNTDEEKLVFGLIFALKPLCNDLGQKKNSNFHKLETNEYKIHNLELSTGIRLVLFSSDVENIEGCLNLKEKLKERTLLMEIYKSLLVPFVLQNPLIDLNKMKENKNRYLLHESKSFIQSFSKLILHSIQKSNQVK